MTSSAITFTYLDADGPVPKSAARNPAGSAGVKETLAAIKAAIADVESGANITLSALSVGDDDIDGDDRLLVARYDDDGNYIGTVAGTVAGVRGAVDDESVSVVPTETVVTGDEYTVTANDWSLWSDEDGLHEHTVRAKHATPSSAVAFKIPISSEIARPLHEFVFIQDLDQTGTTTIEPISGGTLNGGTSAITLAGPGAVVTVTVLSNENDDNPVMLAVGALDGPVVVDSITLSNGPKILSGTGSPENAVTAGKGSIFLRTDASDGTSCGYLKCTGTGNTGWKLITVP